MATGTLPAGRSSPHPHLQHNFQTHTLTRHPRWVETSHPCPPPAPGNPFPAPALLTSARIAHRLGSQLVDKIGLLNCARGAPIWIVDTSEILYFLFLPRNSPSHIATTPEARRAARPCSLLPMDSSDSAVRSALRLQSGSPLLFRNSRMETVEEDDAAPVRLSLYVHA